ncbi:hypothetical protein TPHA_0F03280 [Tetrapisispora phaffii CBS 4417]|uniref:DNA-directed RNA polymerases I, II, and III subunit RPABC3 n=1 Tax=Tetrapisispora phaffii (strain ATCC 24235 / CBS 4417 / NBRC 1672 / NRRL Y-8282 / UCD 70-5) TaxID=1071381 RepID=G8BUM3_TETPH|nr:hypothetical protein TPHA_0F03280 [Tetrapisispora phaffii CBS 4417]CCE63809.1 hypothetical protein TPHA_0F03280 [Tetrapisispora phaffii CBS 4417]
MSSTLFDDIFVISDVDPGRYNKVSRIEASSTSQEQTKLTLDINTDLFPVNLKDQLTIAIASSLSTDGSVNSSDNKSWRLPRPNERSLADDYDYVMYGTAYKFEEVSKDMITIYYSFGGLLMRLEGNYRKLNNLKQENAYLLIRR